ncbi:MAG: HlyD family efflux transporter periplasmic adaptor subunit [Clostridia bacterium]
MRSTPSRRLYSQKKEKPKNKPYSKKSILIIISLLVIAVFLIWRLIFYVPKYEVSIEEWYYEEEVGGRLFYESTPIIANSKGVLHIEAENKSTVSDNENLFLIVNSEREESLRTEIDEIKQKLSEFDLSEIKEPTKELVNEETPIHELRNMVRLYGFYQSELKVSEIVDSYTSILSLEKDYFNYINKIENDRIRYESLQEELNNLEVEYEECSELTTSPAGGILLYQHDNLDSEISNDNIESDYNELLNSEIKKVVVNEGDIVEAGDQIGIIINEKIFYLALNIPKDLSYYLDLAETISISLDDESISYEIVEKDLDNSSYLLSTTDYIDPEDKDLKLKINTEKLEGFYVPKEALISEDENNFVYVYDGRHPVKTSIEILKDEEEKFFVTGLKDGDKIVEDIEEFRR